MLLMSAIAAVQQSKPEEARRQLEHASKLHPDDERIIQQLIGLDGRMRTTRASPSAWSTGQEPAIAAD